MTSRRIGFGITRALAALATITMLAPAAGAQAAARGRVETGRLDPFVADSIQKRLMDAQILRILGAEMVARKVSYPGADGLPIPAYLFAPSDTSVRRPLLILVHGGVHASVGGTDAAVARTLVREGYVVIAPDYRGSTGYGRAFYDRIDYGGKEVEDCVAARDYVARHVRFADTTRVAMVGWSHGGFISIHAVIRRPELFRAAVAHVPVADLPARMRTHPEDYRRIFAEQPGFGGTVEQNPRPYLERSPITLARKLRTPILVHTADNDEDVFIVENHNLRDSMVAAGMDRRGLYTYREFHNPLGGHSFSLYDTPEAQASWVETLAFLRKYLGPP